MPSPDTSSGGALATYNTKSTAAPDNSFMFHYQVFAASECSFFAPKVAGSCTGFQAVAGAKSRCKRFHTVSVCFKPRKFQEIDRFWYSVSSSLAPRSLSQGPETVIECSSCNQRGLLSARAAWRSPRLPSALFRCVRRYPLPGSPDRTRLQKHKILVREVSPPFPYLDEGAYRASALGHVMAIPANDLWIRTPPIGHTLSRGTCGLIWRVRADASMSHPEAECWNHQHFWSCHAPGSRAPRKQSRDMRGG